MTLGNIIITGGASGLGAATVKAGPGKDSECARAQATVDLQTTARINGLVMGLATNSETLGRRAAARRFPTPAERAARTCGRST